MMIPKHFDFLDSEYLFWGNSALKSILSSDERNHLCDLEFIDWLSSLYWGEGIAMNYALKMSQISKNKEKWLEVYKDEHRHQTMIGGWFIERGLAPLPKNKLIDFAFRSVERLSSSMNEEEIIKTIYRTQVFYEELFHSLLKYRLKHIKDRDLKAIFYQIFIDESDHLSKARSEIMEMNIKPKRPYEILEENKTKLFPLEIGKQLLDSDKLLQVREVQEKIVSEILEEAKSSKHLFKPLPILHRFQKIPGYNCIACSPSRSDGLHLEPIFNPELNLIEDTYIFPKRCEGFNSVVHGGFIGMVLDEMMCYSPILTLNQLPVTSSMTVEFKKPVIVGNPYKLEAYITEQKGQVILTKACIKDMDGNICAQSEGKLFVPSKVQAPRILGELGNHASIREMFV